MNMMTKNELLRLKDEIEEAKTKTAESNGQLSALLTQLADQYNCKSVQAAEKRIESLSTEIDKLQSQIDDGLTELEEKYGNL